MTRLCLRSSVFAFAALACGETPQNSNPATAGAVPANPVASAGNSGGAPGSRSAATGGSGAFASGGIGAAGGTPPATGGSDPGSVDPGVSGQGAGAPAGQEPDGGQGAQSVDCAIEPTLTMSSAIGTVGIVEFTTDLEGMDAARIEFGLDTAYGMTAPVDLDDPGYRTLLLGMKPGQQYHYRVVVEAGGAECSGEDQTLQTGDLPAGPFELQLETPEPEKLYQGFIVTVLGGTTATIFDHEGDVVWWHEYSGSGASRARMSYDGKHMWMVTGNPFGGDGLMERVSMDGLDVETFGLDSELGDTHHDLTVLPDNGVLFLGHNTEDTCDSVKELSPDGSVRTIFSATEVTGSTNCHLNSLHYHPDDDTITFSDRIQLHYVKVTRDGEIVWVLGGAASTFTGDGAAWSGGGQHGHQMLGPDRMLMFENGDFGSPSIVYELELDLEAATATRVWEYDGGAQTPILGDAVRLPNGNTAAVYTAAGLMHEVDPEGNLVRSTTSTAGGITYIQRRETLYGPPPEL